MTDIPGCTWLGHYIETVLAADGSPGWITCIRCGKCWSVEPIQVCTSCHAARPHPARDHDE